MRAFAWSVLSSLVVLGCGSKDPTTPPDGPAGDDDAAIDASPDAPPPVSNLVLNDGTATIAQWTSPSTFVGTSTTMRFFVANLGTTNTGTLTSVLGGANASQFALVGPSTCAQLVAGDLCTLDVRFSPTAAATATATLTVSDGTQQAAISLMGVALGPSPGLVADVASVTFLPITRGDNTTAQVIISNSSASTITLGPRTAAAPFSVTTDNCSASLTPGGACTVTVRIDGTTVGNNTGMLHVTSSANALDVPLDGVVLRKITVAGSGFGTGVVTSLPTGINCPSTCSYGFPGGVPIAFSATADAGNNFVEWGGLCSGATCSVASPLDGTVSATFIPTSAKKVTVTMAGSSRGYAGVQTTSGGTSYGRCTSSCVIYVPTGSQITVYGYSPSTFVGWTGDCTSATNDCNLGTVIADRTVTLTTAADPHEIATLLPPAAITGLAIAPTGNLIVGTSAGVSEIALSGTAVWTTAIAGGASSLATDAAGHIYGLGGPGVFSLTAAGTLAWTRTFTGAPVEMSSLHGSLAVSPDGSVVAVLTSDGVHVVDGAGVDRFTITGVSPVPQTVAVAPDGTVGLSQLDQSMASDQTRALRYSNTGTPLATYTLLPGHTHTSIAFDSTSAVCAISTGMGHSTVSRTTAPSVLAFSSDIAGSGAGAIPAGVVTTSTGEVVGIRNASQLVIPPGVRFDVFSPTGTTVLSQTKTSTPFAFASQISLYDGVTVQRVAAGGTNRIAIAGLYEYTLPWIQVYDLP